MEVLLGRSYTSLSRPGLYCSHRLKFSSLFCPGSLIKEICLRNLVRHWKSLRKGKKQTCCTCPLFHVPFAALLCSLHLSSAAMAAMPLSGQASHRTGSWPSLTDLILQVCPWTCLLTRDLPGNLLLVHPGHSHQDCLTPHMPILGDALLAF